MGMAMDLYLLGNFRCHRWNCRAVLSNGSPQTCSMAHGRRAGNPGVRIGSREGIARACPAPLRDGGTNQPQSSIAFVGLFWNRYGQLWYRVLFAKYSDTVVLARAIKSCAVGDDSINAGHTGPAFHRLEFRSIPRASLALCFARSTRSDIIGTVPVYSRQPLLDHDLFLDRGSRNEILHACLLVTSQPIPDVIGGGRQRRNDQLDR